MNSYGQQLSGSLSYEGARIINAMKKELPTGPEILMPINKKINVN